MRLSSGQQRRVASVPSLGQLALSRSYAGVLEQQMMQQQHQHVAPFSPCFFDLELESRVASSNHLSDRCFSEMQLQQLGEEGRAGAGSLLQQILLLCRCTSPAQAQLLAQLQRLRSSACVLVSSNNSPAVRQYPDDSNSSSSSKGSAGDNSQHGSADVRGPDAAGLPPGESQQQVPAASHHIGSNTCRSFLVPAASLDIEGMACELLAQGYLVQVRDGAAASQQQQDRTKPCTRSCLQNLRHRFIVCLGWRSSADGEPVYLPEPLVLEPRLREQFSIAHPTAEYEALLQSVPPCFVGPTANLEGVVKLLCEQMTATFKQQGLPVPPWRTHAALLSKWCPAQLAELQGKIEALRSASNDAVAAAAAAAGRALAPCQSHDTLCNDERPAAVHAPHAAVGSAPSTAASNRQTLQAAVQQQQVVLATAQQPAWQGGTTAATAVATAAAGNDPRCIAAGAAANAPLVAADVADMLGPLGAADLTPGMPGGTLKFTRKASAEWKHQRSIKGLLAAALKTNTTGTYNSSHLPAEGSMVGRPPVAVGVALHSSSASCTAAAGEPQAPGGAGTGADAPIRRTHFRASGDEPWRRITTVRWGAYAQQQAQQQQQQPQQQQHVQLQQDA